MRVGVSRPLLQVSLKRRAACHGENNGNEYGSDEFSHFVAPIRDL